ncbi:hypothetical protein I41_52210 [Lacipirellula limnantheis]|uniref:Uncharacterized protein n=1 Tax=Lacipirellula limnantheis TaxID=2528024 RepID=A0A517U5S3_9BACT|nr:hypothetical protein I41_52210 [Lacipirellula limnantheis]
MDQSVDIQAPPAVGLVYVSRVLAPGPLCHLLYGDRIVTASIQAPFLGMTKSLVWTWLDGDECSLQYPSSRTELRLNGRPQFEIPYVGFCKGGEQYIWRRISDKLRLVTAEFVRGKNCLNFEYRFYNQERTRLGTFKREDLWNYRLGRRRPMPLYDFQGSLVELNLIWAFILLQQFCRSD